LFRHHRDRAGVPPEYCEQLAIIGRDREVRAEGGLDSLLESQSRTAPLPKNRSAGPSGELQEECAESILLVVKVVVEGPGREVRLAHDVACGGLPETLLREDPPSRRQQLGPVLCLAFLAPPPKCGRVRSQWTHTNVVPDLSGSKRTGCRRPPRESQTANR